MLLPGTKVIAKYDLEGARVLDECMVLDRKDNLYLVISLSEDYEAHSFWAIEDNFMIDYRASDLVYHNASGRVCIFQQEDMNGYCLSYYGSTEDAFYASANEITKIPFNVFYDV
jgi:hypothetical protein